MTRPSISIAITTHNRLQDLRKTLEALAAWRGQFDQILVCADGCSDGTQEYIRKNYPEIHLMENNPGRGSIPSRNRLISESPSPLVLLLDDDSYPMEADFFKTVLQVMQEHPDIGVLTFPQRSDEFPETLIADVVGTESVTMCEQGTHSVKIDDNGIC